MLQVEHPPPQRRPRSVETWNRLLGVREEPADPVDVRQQMRQALPPRESRDRQYLRDDQRLIFVVEHCTSYRPRLETGLGGSQEKYIKYYSRLVDEVISTVVPGQPDNIEVRENPAPSRWPTMERSIQLRWARSHIEARPQLPAGPKPLINGYQPSFSRLAVRPKLLEPAPWSGPRTGSFEVVWSLLSAGKCIGSGLLFSKLRVQKWPNISRLVQKLDDEVQDILFMRGIEQAQKQSVHTAEAQESAQALEEAEKAAETEAAEAEAARREREEQERMLMEERRRGDAEAVRRAEEALEEARRREAAEAAEAEEALEKRVSKEIELRSVELLREVEEAEQAMMKCRSKIFELRKVGLAFEQYGHEAAERTRALLAAETVEERQQVAKQLLVNGKVGGSDAQFSEHRALAEEKLAETKTMLRESEVQKMEAAHAKVAKELADVTLAKLRAERENEDVVVALARAEEAERAATEMKAVNGVARDVAERDAAALKKRVLTEQAEAAEALHALHEEEADLAEARADCEEMEAELALQDANLEVTEARMMQQVAVQLVLRHLAVITTGGSDEELQRHRVELDAMRERSTHEVEDAKVKVEKAKREFDEAASAIQACSEATMRAAQTIADSHMGAQSSCAALRVAARKRRADDRASVAELDDGVRQRTMMTIDEEIEEMEERWQDLIDELERKTHERDEMRAIKEMETVARQKQRVADQLAGAADERQNEYERSVAQLEAKGKKQVGLMQMVRELDHASSAAMKGDSAAQREARAQWQLAHERRVGLLEEAAAHQARLAQRHAERVEEEVQPLLDTHALSHQSLDSNPLLVSIRQRLSIVTTGQEQRLQTVQSNFESCCQEAQRKEQAAIRARSAKEESEAQRTGLLLIDSRRRRAEAMQRVGALKSQMLAFKTKHESNGRLRSAGGTKQRQRYELRGQIVAARLLYQKRRKQSAEAFARAQAERAEADEAREASRKRLVALQALTVKVHDIMARAAKSNAELAGAQEAFYEKRPNEASAFHKAREELATRVAQADEAAARRAASLEALESQERLLAEERKKAQERALADRMAHARHLFEEVLTFVRAKHDVVAESIGRSEAAEASLRAEAKELRVGGDTPAETIAQLEREAEQLSRRRMGATLRLRKIKGKLAELETLEREVRESEKRNNSLSGRARIEANEAAWVEVALKIENKKLRDVDSEPELEAEPEEDGADADDAWEEAASNFNSSGGAPAFGTGTARLDGAAEVGGKPSPPLCNDTFPPARLLACSSARPPPARPPPARPPPARPPLARLLDGPHPPSR